jgi:hypothetical protein
MLIVNPLQAVEKRPSASFPCLLVDWQAFVAAAYIEVRLTPQAFGSLASGHF